MKRLTAEEVCRTLELMTLHIDEEWASEIYTLLHHREGGACCRELSSNVIGAIEQSHKIKEYWENLNKAPADPTKIHNMEYPK